MANRYWRGVNNNWTDTANWSTTRTGSTGSVVPTSSEDVYIYDGDLDITTNITAVAANSLTIGGEFSGNITGLTVNAAACPVTIEKVAFGKNIVIGADAAVTLAAIHIRSTGQGTVTLASGAAGIITTVRAGLVGRLIGQGSAPVTNYYNAGMSDDFDLCTTAFTIAEYRKGVHDLRRNAATFRADVGALVRTYKSVAFTTGAHVGAGSTLLHDSDGTIAKVFAYPGGTLQPVSTKFIVTDADVWEGGNVNRNSDKITFTNAPVPVGNPA